MQFLMDQVKGLQEENSQLKRQNGELQQQITELRVSAEKGKNKFIFDPNCMKPPRPSRTVSDHSGSISPKPFDEGKAKRAKSARKPQFESLAKSVSENESVECWTSEDESFLCLEQLDPQMAEDVLSLFDTVQRAEI